MNTTLIFIVSVVSGLYTSLWGAFKDCPYEGFKTQVFPRSICLSIAISFLLYSIPCFQDRFVALSVMQMFFLIMGIERLCTEIYKGCFRCEDQEKYFIPSRITFLGKYITSNAFLHGLGVILLFGALTLLFLKVNVEALVEFLLVSFCVGLAGAFGGAWKDAPFEGFRPLNFLRTPVVSVLTSPLLSSFGPVSLGFLIYMSVGLERFIVEYYKTYIQSTTPGKFRPDLQRNQEQVDAREKFRYIALLVVLVIIILTIHDIRGSS